MTKGAELLTKTQKENILREYKMEAKRVAIQAAGGNRPLMSSQLNYGTQQLPPPHYDIVVEAEKIYQWLLKGIE